jgi:predicted DNA-binding transcriptional regulator YafY
MFNSDELKALALGAMMVQAWSDHELASVTKTAIRKIESILPEKLRKEIELEQIVVPNFQLAEATSDNLAGIRHAIDEQMKLFITYHSLKGDQTNRTIWPFLLYFWGNKWTLGAWCELRQEFRSFRVDLIEGAEVADAFPTDPERSLQAYVDYQRDADWRSAR